MEGMVGSGDPLQWSTDRRGQPCGVDMVAGRLAGFPKELLHVEREARRMGLPEPRGMRSNSRRPWTASRHAVPAARWTGCAVRPAEICKHHPQAPADIVPAADRQSCAVRDMPDACPPEAIEIKNSA